MVSPRILITRLSAIGDCLQTLPLAAALKSHWPECDITWLVDCGAESILKAQTNIDRVIRVRKGFLKRPSEMWSLTRELRRSAFDIAIDPQGLMKSSLTARLSGAKHRIGFAAGQAREQAWRLYHDCVEPFSTHLVDRHLELLKPLGIASEQVEFGWTEPDDIAEQADFIAKDLGWPKDSWFVVNPGAGWASRRWSLERFQGLIQQIHERYGYRCLVVWGDKAESQMANEIVSANREITKLAPPTSLMLLSGLIKRSRFFVGSDTGPMHLASAVGTPCIAMFGTTRAEYSGPYGTIHQRLQKRFDAGSSAYRRSTTTPP